MSSRAQTMPVAAVQSDRDSVAAESRSSDNALFRAAFECAPVGMAHLTAEGLFLRVNPKLCEMTGYRPDELTRMSFRDITLSGDDGPDDEARRTILATQGSSCAVERRCVRKNGETFWVHIVTTMLRAADGASKVGLSVIEDITLRKRAESLRAGAVLEHGRHADRMAALVEAQRELASTDATFEQLMQRIPALALGVVNGAAAMIDLIDGDAMVCRAGSAAALDAIVMRIPIGEGFSGEAVRLNRTLRCDDTETDPRVASVACRAFGLRSVLATVVRDRDGPIGVLKLVACQPAHFGAAEADSLEILAEALGAVMQRRRADEEARHSIRIQAGIVCLQQDLATSQGDLQAKMNQLVERTQELTGAAGAALVLVEGDEMVYRAGSGSAVGHRELRLRRAGSLVGLTVERDAPLRCDDIEIEPEVNLEACRKVGARSMATAPVRVGNAVVGVLTAVSDRTHAFGQREAGTLQMLAECLGVVMQREAAALRLQMSEAQYRLVFSANPLPMWTFDTETLRFLAVNDAAIARYGYTSAEFLSMTIRDIRTEASARSLERYLALGDPGGPMALTLQHRTKDGTVIDAEVLSNAIRFTDRPARLVLVHDVTERERAVRKLRNNEAILAIAGRVAKVAGWSFDLSACVFAYSVELCEMHDLPAGSTVSLEQALDFYAPESRPAMLEAVNACSAHGTPYDLELEIITARGRRIGVRTIGQAVRDAAGVIVGTQGALQDITERRAAQVLQAAESLRFDTALNNISQGVCFFDGQQRLIVCNRLYAELYRLSPNVMRPGTTLREIVDHRFAAGSVPDTTPSEYLAWRQSLVRTNQASDTVVRLKDGRTVAIHHQPMPDGGWVATHEDITERRAAQEALRSLNDSLEVKVAQRTSQLESTNSALASKEEEIRSVVEHMADGVINFDDAGIVRSANPMVEATFGYAPAELIGVNIAALVPALAALAGAAALDDGGERVASFGRETREARGLDRNGGGIALEVAISQYRIKGQRLWTAILRDIGERVAIMADLEQARYDAEQASRAKSAFVATMSHEIRTPMNGVIGMIDVLEQTELAPDQARMLDLARDSAYSLMGIIEEILDFSKIEAGKVELECEPISIAAILEKVSALVAGVAASRGVAMVSCIDVAVPKAVWGDALRVRQVLVNLVNNAIKFSSGRGVGARVTVSVTASRSTPARVMLDLVVEDNGIGMDAATIDSLFKPFSQADASTTRRFGGTGLGLAISSQLVELMGGEILVSGTPDVGSSFTVRLPFEVAPQGAANNTVAPADPPRTLPGGAALRRGSSLRDELLLVAEDNEINQHVITAQLKLLGFKAEVVGNGRDALVQWRTGRFALLLTDLQMPEMDGYDLTAIVRSEEGARARTPIVALTANALKEESNRCKAAGMDDYLTKPVPLATLEAMLLRWLKAPRAAAPVPAPQSPSQPRHAGAMPADPAVLASLVGDDPAVLREFFLDFARVASEAEAALVSALQGGRLRDAASVAHRLRASALAVGALELGEQCAGIEAAAGAANDVALHAAIPFIRAEVAKVRDWIQAHCAEAREKVFP